MMNSLVIKARETNNFIIVKEYDIPYELTKTTRGKKFLFYDSGIQDENRIVVFTTDENISHLINCKIMICDGTFKSAPKNFEQIFTLQCNARNKNLPLLYCFMKTNNKYFCNKLFEWLNKEIKEEVVKEKNIILNFERASMNAFKKFFTSSKLYGCNFHLGQIVLRRVQNMKFAQEFMKNDEVKLHVKMILAPSFVSLDDVLLLAARLNVLLKTEKFYDGLRLFRYFKAEYLVENDSNKSVSFWNVFDRTLNGIPRMINSIEEMHKHLNSLVKVKQASFFLILKKLIIEQEITENKLLQSLYCDSTINVEDKIKEILNRYSEYYGVEFLKKIAFSFRWKLN